MLDYIDITTDFHLYTIYHHKNNISNHCYYYHLKLPTTSTATSYILSLLP